MWWYIYIQDPQFIYTSQELSRGRQDARLALVGEVGERPWRLPPSRKPPAPSVDVEVPSCRGPDVSTPEGYLTASAETLRSPQDRTPGLLGNMFRVGQLIAETARSVLNQPLRTSHWPLALRDAELREMDEVLPAPT